MKMPTETGPSLDLPRNGPGAAAVLAAGAGAFAVGVLAFAADKVPSFARLLVFYRPTGPLSGVSTGAILIWLMTWAALHYFWKRRDVDLHRVVMLSLGLLAIGILLTFPPFADAL